MVYLPNGRLANCSSDNKVKVWGITEGKNLYTLNNKKRVNALAVLLNNHLACGLVDGVIRIWFGVKLKKTIKAHKDPIVSLTETHGYHLISQSCSGEIKIWNPYLDEESMLLMVIDAMYVGSVACPLGVLSNGYLVTCSSENSNGMLKVWNPKNGKMLQQMETHITMVTSLLVLKNDHVVLGSIYGAIKIFDVVNKSVVHALSLFGPDSATWAMCQLEDGQLFVACSQTNPHFKLLNPQTGELIQTFPTGHMGTITCLSIRKNLIASGSSDNSIKLWILENEFV